MKHFFVTIWLVCLIVTSSAQGRWNFSIRNQETHFPIPGISVTSVPGNQSTFSNEQGNVELKTLPGDTLLMFSGIGIKTTTLPLNGLNRDSVVVYLASAPVELKEVTISGNPADQYTPISKIDIALRGINNSQEILRMVPGLFIGQHAGGGKAEQIFLRGFDLDHGTDINLTVDGMPVNMVSHAHGQGYADLHFLIPETVEQVTFKKGTYDASKGNMATSGFVDFKSIDVLANDMIKMEGGMFGTFRSMGMFNLLKKSNREKQQGAYVAAEYMHTDSYFDNGQDFNRVNLFLKYNGRLSPTSTLSLTASGFSSQWNASGQVPDRAYEWGLIGFYGSIDPNEGGNTSRINLNSQVNTTLSNGMLLKNQLFFSTYNFLLYSNFTFYLHDSINGDQIRQKEKRDLFGYNGSLDKVSYLGSTRLTSVVGINSRVDITKGSELSRTKNREQLLSPLQLGDITESNIGVYTDQTFRFSNRISLNAAIRFDQFFYSYVDRLANGRHSDATASIISPKINLYYHLNGRTQFYASAGRGFHSNDTRVVVARQGLKTLPAAYGADIGTVLKPTANLLLNIAGWYMWMDQEFIYVGDEGLTEPGGKSQRVGIDISARYQPLKWMFFDADVNYSHARAVKEVKGENYLPLAPGFTSIGGITIKRAGGLNGSLRYRYMGDRPANEDNSVVAGGYLLCDALLSYTKCGFELFLSVQNIFNTKWKETQFNTESRLQHEPAPVSEIHFTPGTPFSLKAGVTYSFGK